MKREASYFSTIKIRMLAVTVMLLCLISGCVSMPQYLKDTGVQALEKCPADLGLETGKLSAVVASIDTDMANGYFYLLLKNETGNKFVLQLNPKVIGIPKDGRFDARTFCFAIAPGNYQVTKVIATVMYTSPSGSRELYREYDHQRDLNIPLYNAVYIGRYILLDPRNKKDEGFFERAGRSFGDLFKGSVLPDTLKINVVDKIDEDSAWLLDEHKKIRTEQIINTTM